jgi:hypothetical protein
MITSKLLTWLSKPKHLWISVFLYTVISGLFVQFILLPYIFPSWHAGNGLLEGVDATKFHRIALELTEKIEESGWSQWEPLPDGQLVSGVAAIFYVLINPAPWSVLPLNGVLNSFACVCFYLILFTLLKDERKSLLCALPFIFFPSNLLWNTQFHNENYAVPGIILTLYGWVVISNNKGNQNEVISRENIIALFSIVVGSLFIGLVRISILPGLTFLFVIIGIGFVLAWIFKRDRNRKLKRIPLVGIAISMMLTVVFIFENNISLDADFKLNYGESEIPLSSNQNEVRKLKWENTSWIPGFLDNQFEDIAMLRRRFIKAWDHAGSNIDADITFRNAEEVTRYLPRAAQIAFFSPFPNMWFSEGRKVTGTAMRVISAFEMMVIYFCIVGLPMILWSNRHQPALWVVVYVCTGMLIVYALTIPNLGSLYRFRYPYLMPLVCLGLAGWMKRLISKPNHPEDKEAP